MGKKPNIQLEDFVKGYRFLRVPKAYAGEAFTKVRLEVFLLMKSKLDDRLRLYKSTYTVPMTAKFIKDNRSSVETTGRVIKVTDAKQLAEDIVSWDDDNTSVDTDIEKEFDSDFSIVMDEILDLQNEARDRGWIVL